MEINETVITILPNILHQCYNKCGMFLRTDKYQRALIAADGDVQDGSMTMAARSEAWVLDSDPLEAWMLSRFFVCFSVGISLATADRPCKESCEMPKKVSKMRLKHSEGRVGPRVRYNACTRRRGTK